MNKRKIFNMSIIYTTIICYSITSQIPWNIYKRLINLSSLSLSFSHIHVRANPLTSIHNLIQSSIEQILLWLQNFENNCHIQMPPSLRLKHFLETLGELTGRTGVILISKSLNSPRVHCLYHSFDSSNIYSFMLVCIVLFLWAVYPSLKGKINLIARDVPPFFTQYIIWLFRSLANETKAIILPKSMAGPSQPKSHI